MLKKNRKYRYPDGRTIVVEKVTTCSATVRPVGRKTVEIGNRKFTTSTMSFTISKHSELEEIS